MVAGIDELPPQEVAEKEVARRQPERLVLVENPNAVQTGLDTQGTLVATGIRQIVADLGVAVLQKKEELTSLVTEGRKQQQEDDEQIQRQLEAALKLAPLTTKAMDS